MEDLESLFELIRRRFSKAPIESCDRRDILQHLRSISRWAEEPMDYPIDDKPIFPDVLSIAFAVCHPDCGAKEFLVDGSTQRCQHCGGLMFRTEVVTYERKT